MNFKCNACGFETTVEGEYMTHVRQHVSQDREKHSYPAPQFIPKLKGKVVRIALVTGEMISGTLTGYNQYELELNNELIVFKGAIATLQANA